MVYVNPQVVQTVISVVEIVSVVVSQKVTVSEIVDVIHSSV